jgi:hypothetical protein
VTCDDARYLQGNEYAVSNFLFRVRREREQLRPACRVTRRNTHTIGAGAGAGAGAEGGAVALVHLSCARWAAGHVA